MRKLVSSSFVLVIALLIAACTGLPPTAQPQVSPIKPVETAAETLAVQTSPLATSATANEDAPLQPGTGGVKGELHREDGTPIRGVIIYAALIENRGGMELSAVDPISDPKMETDASGAFRIGNLKPGRYALAAQSPVGIIMPHNNEGKTVIYQVEADKTTDLGKLDVGYVYPDAM